MGPVPFAKQIATVIGKPIKVERCEKPTLQQVDTLHDEYCFQLESLFEAHKEKYGVSADTHLNFVTVK